MSDTSGVNMTDKREQTTPEYETPSVGYSDDFEYFTGSGEQISSLYGTSTMASLNERVAEARERLGDSERFIKRLGAYDLRRLEYSLNLNRYRFSAEPGAAQKHEKRMNRRIISARMHSLKAWFYEYKDNRRYAKALKLNPDDTRLRGPARPERLIRQKSALVALLAERDRINKELSSLYAESNHEYIGATSGRKLLGIRLNAARKAYRRLCDTEQDVRKYIFAPEDKQKLIDLMNHSIDLSAEQAVLCYRRRRATDHAVREQLRIAIAEKKQERSKIERSIHSLIFKARRKTYLYGEGGVWRWVVGIAIAIAFVIAVLCIFHDPLSALLETKTV